MGLKLVKLGITGGIASGKSTVAALFAARGATLIDADAISKSLTAANGAAITPLQNLFGSSILTADGALNREKMRHFIYADAQARLKLEGVLHPLVQGEMLAQIEQAKSTGSRCVVLDIPLLVESKYWRKMLDRVLVIDCAEKIQLERVMRRNGLEASEVTRIMDVQEKRMNRLRAADLVLVNEDPELEALAQQVQEIGAQFGL